ncbi:hypothetical protein AVEN_87785-1 [Araneus ventricosus]|uniref:Uncharacterized protein n=1 Tax=Araneus ventricosus TaxID=182803 RepID=A0A4Y2QWC8_ARAVE|nr:hypothetical protein AVEN_157242-1 [Araneus ventricosus]GBN67500.1 hypothetical protein AVEN_87785-1 [Araneus ventricosus]
MYRSFQNETNRLPKLWIRISDSESESVIPNPRNQGESNSDSRIRFRGFITNPILRIHHGSISADPSRIRFRGFGGFVPFSRFVPFARNRIRSFLLRIRIIGFVPE